jgi:hypothetical protein
MEPDSEQLRVLVTSVGAVRARKPRTLTVWAGIVEVMGICTCSQENIHVIAT